EPAGRMAFDVQAVVSGTIAVSGGAAVLTGELRDFPARRLIARSEFRGGVNDVRRLVHRFADDVVFRLTGERGIAETRIAYVFGSGRVKELYAVDYDGYDPRPLTAFKALTTSP